MKAYTLKIVLTDSNPVVWRSLKVPAFITFQRLHEVIQGAMLWHDYHEFEFVSLEDTYRFVEEQEIIDEQNAMDEQDRPKWQYKLAKKVQIDRFLTRDKEVFYTYDFGDYWNIDVTLESICEDYDKPYATCLAGEHPAPPEDVGGWDGFQQFLEALCDPANEDHEEMLEWSEGWKDQFDKRAINAALRKVILKRTPVASSVREPKTVQPRANNVIDLSSPRAKWLALPQALREQLLKNAYCPHCGITEIVDYHVSSEKQLVFIEGKCKKCGKTISRCLD